MRILFHSKESISLRRFARMIDTGDKGLVRRFWFPVPGFILRKKYDSFINDYNDLFNSESINNMFDHLTDQLYLKGMINLYRQIYYGIVILKDPKCMDIYEEEFGFKPETKGHIELLIKETTKLKEQYEEAENLLKKKNEASTKSEFTFYDIVTGIGMLIGLVISYDTKLIEFYSYYKQGLKISAKNKQNGKG